MTNTTELAKAAEKYRSTLEAHRNNPRDGVALNAWDDATSKFMELVDNDELNIISGLLEALEKAKGMETYWKTQCRGITDHCEELQARIAELESHTVKPPVHPTVASENLDDETLQELIEFRRTTFEYHSKEGNKVQTIIHGVTLAALRELQERRKADSDPVAYTDERNLGYIDRGRETAYLWGKQNSEASDVALYRHAQPALVVPDEIKHRIGGLDWGWEGEFNRGWNACRAAMLQAEPVCTCPSGDGSLRWPCPVHPGSSPVIPDGYVMVPMRLTAENGAKGALSGEFSETKFVNCPECFGDDECETCDGSGRIEITVPVTWTTIKEIWVKGVEHFAAAPQSPGGDHATVPGKWIPVSERLPEDSGRYWCYVEEQNDLGKSHYQWNCSWNGDRWWVESEGGGIVTYWMPLPAAPQEVNRE